MIQGLWLSTSTAEDMGSIPGQGTRISECHVVWSKHKKLREAKCDLGPLVCDLSSVISVHCTFKKFIHLFYGLHGLKNVIKYCEITMLRNPSNSLLLKHRNQFQVDLGRWILYHLSQQGSPRILGWVAYPFSRGSSRSRNRTGVSCIAGGFFTNWATRKALEFNMNS